EERLARWAAEPCRLDFVAGKVLGMRGWPGPRALFVSGAALLLVTIVGVALAHVFRAQRVLPRAGVGSSRVTTSPVPLPKPAFAILRMRTAVLGPFSTLVSWETAAPSTGRVAWGLAGGRSLLWTG